MQESLRIQEHAHRTFAGEAWHGPGLLEILSDVDLYTALERKIPGKYNIWELVLHIEAWIRLATRALDGVSVPADLSTKEDWPPISEKTEVAWRRTIEDLKQAHREFVERVAALDDADLGATVPGRDYNVSFLCSGVVHHTLYHAGQIALLKSLSGPLS